MEDIIRLHPEDMATIANLITDGLRKVDERDEQLLNLKELSEALSVPYSTLAKKVNKLPHVRLDRRGRNMYRLRDVRASLKR